MSFLRIIKTDAIRRCECLNAFLASATIYDSYHRAVGGFILFPLSNVFSSHRRQFCIKENAAQKSPYDKAYRQAETEQVKRAFSLTLPSETEKVTQAFNIIEPCSFVIPDVSAYDWLEERARRRHNYEVDVFAILTSSSERENPTWFRYGNMHVHVNYGTIGYSIKFIRGRFEKSPLGIASVELFIPAVKLAQTHSPNIDCFDRFTPAEIYHVAKGIFHLGLLDAKV